MASAQEPSVVKLYVRKPSGHMYLLMDKRVEEIGPSGSADHVVQSTPEKWTIIPMSNVPINRGDVLVCNVISDAADTTDYSDCVFSIPFVHQQTGVVKTVSDGDMTGADIALIASTEVTLATYEFVGGPYFFGGKIFMSVEDDTA